MGLVYLPGKPLVSEGATRLASVDLTNVLDSGESATGTPTVTEQTTSDLTIANVAVNTAALTIKGRTSAIGKAVQFKFSGQQDGTTYDLKLTVSTDSDPAQTIIRGLYFECAD